MLNISSTIINKIFLYKLILEVKLKTAIKSVAIEIFLVIHLNVTYNECL